MSLHHQTFGRTGERLAEAYLVELGAGVPAWNHRIPHAEIDLLLEYQRELVAVE